MFAYERTDLQLEMRQYFVVSNVAGATVRAWREHGGMTLAALGEECPKPLTRNRVADIEGGRGSAQVDTLLNIIAGIEKFRGQPLGATDGERLARFFLGPSVEDAFERFESAAGRVMALRRVRRR